MKIDYILSNKHFLFIFIILFKILNNQISKYQVLGNFHYSNTKRYFFKTKGKLKLKMEI